MGKKMFSSNLQNYFLHCEIVCSIKRKLEVLKRLMENMPNFTRFFVEDKI